MQDPAFACPDCGAACADDDNYCRKCGMYLVAVRDPVALATRPTRAVERYQRERAPLPAPLKRAAAAIAVGAAAQVGLSLASRYFAGQAAQKAARAAITAAAANGAPRKTRAVQQPARSGLPEDIAAVSETVIVRRLWVRRP
jgi:uncharacterized membrane protein YvbJ